MLSEAESNLVHVAFASMDHDGSGLVPLDELKRTFDASQHPRVKEGSLASSAARDMLDVQFGTCAAEHNGCITLDEFICFHEKLVYEAENEKVADVEAMVTETIQGLWRLGNLLLPTGIRPAIPIDQPPIGLHGSMLMSFVWVEADTQSGEFILRGCKDVVRPIFARGDLPEELRGLFAFPEELTGLNVQYVPPIISVKRWLDFVWEYADDKYCGVEGVISARLNLDALPECIRQFILEHHESTRRKSLFIKTAQSTNPMYKRSSQEYGCRVTEECHRTNQWKINTYLGQQYGLQYYGRFGKFFSKMKGPMQSNSATGINL